MCFFYDKFEVFRIVLKEESNYGKMDMENVKRQHKKQPLQVSDKRIMYSRNQRGCKNWYYEKN